MDNGKNSKGESGVTPTALDTLVLTYNRATDHLEIGGACYSLDLMLDMLGRATRVLEARQRIENAKAMQAELAQAARDAAIAEQIRNRR
jgi:hypothetical protein